MLSLLTLEGTITLPLSLPTKIFGLVDEECMVGGHWSWGDGSTWSYTNWGPNEPNNLNDGEDCIITNWFDRNGGPWNDASCNHVANTLCQVPAT